SGTRDVVWRLHAALCGWAGRGALDVRANASRATEEGARRAPERVARFLRAEARAAGEGRGGGEALSETRAGVSASAPAGFAPPWRPACRPRRARPSRRRWSCLRGAE